ncbi:MAG: NADH:flavin oxidoreductase, partial [Deltaproteobacteria bacterium]|nr:NADH:flavin oxidoreductase [Deltaproteobacteria bacterium]
MAKTLFSMSFAGIGSIRRFGDSYLHGLPPSVQNGPAACLYGGDALGPAGGEYYGALCAPGGPGPVDGVAAAMTPRTPARGGGGPGRGVFDRTMLGTTVLRNRVFRAAVGDDAEDGEPGPESLRLYGALADGGAGAILTGFTLVDDLEKGFMPIFSLAEDRTLDAHKELAGLIRSKGAAAIAQLVHIGSYQSTAFHKAVTPRLPFLTLLSPSGLHDPVCGASPRMITRSEIHRVQDRHAEAALRAKKAGYSGVEIHAAHGFLLSQFMQPGINRREDEYGGSADNRARMALQTYRAVRSAVGSGFPVLMKVNVRDGFAGGCDLKEVVGLCRTLAREGLDAVEISGDWRDFPQDAGPFFAKEAGEIASQVAAKVILTGGLRTLAQMRRVLDETHVEYLGVARPLMKDPGFVNRL